jgi:hypothetical protein
MLVGKMLAGLHLISVCVFPVKIISGELNLVLFKKQKEYKDAQKKEV